ncbi:MAG: hypothetical protein HKN29_07415, partial [Rhodothermales bacterium]|nr:hypothetical protein [Rhodothermales bacterium]
MPSIFSRAEGSLQSPFLFLVAVLFATSCTASMDEPAESPTAGLAAMVADEYSGDLAFETVAYLDQFVRWPGNRGFNASIRYVAAGLEAAGYVEDPEGSSDAPLSYRVESYPMDTPAWEPLAATVRFASGDTLLDFSTNRNMLARMSHATPEGGQSGRVVDIGDREDVPCEEIRGRIVLGNQNAGRLWRRLQSCGVMGVLGYSLADYLQPEVNQTSIQFTSIPWSSEPGWAIALSYAARAEL